MNKEKSHAPSSGFEHSGANYIISGHGGCEGIEVTRCNPANARFTFLGSRKVLDRDLKCGAAPSIEWNLSEGALAGSVESTTGVAEGPVLGRL